MNELLAQNSETNLQALCDVTDALYGVVRASGARLQVVACVQRAVVSRRAGIRVVTIHAVKT